MVCESDPPVRAGRGLGRLVARLTFAASLSGTALVASDTSALASPAVSNPYGSFTLSGAISGTLVLSASTCSASKSATDVTFEWFGTSHLRAISKQSVVSIELDLGKGRYGRSGSLKNSNGQPPFVSFGATLTSFSLNSTSGSYATTPKGTNGTMDVTLKGLGVKRELTIRGSWRKCAPAPGT